MSVKRVIVQRDFDTQDIDAAEVSTETWRQFIFWNIRSDKIVRVYIGDPDRLSREQSNLRDWLNRRAMHPKIIQEVERSSLLVIPVPRWSHA